MYKIMGINSSLCLESNWPICSIDFRDLTKWLYILFFYVFIYVCTLSLHIQTLLQGIPGWFSGLVSGHSIQVVMLGMLGLVEAC